MRDLETVFDLDCVDSILECKNCSSSHFQVGRLTLSMGIQLQELSESIRWMCARGVEGRKAQKRVELWMKGRKLCVREA